MTALGWASVVLLALVLPATAWMVWLLRDPRRNPYALALYFRNVVAVTGLDFGQARRVAWPLVGVGATAVVLGAATLVRATLDVTSLVVLALPLVALVAVCGWILLALRVGDHRRWGPRAFDAMSDQEFENWALMTIAAGSLRQSRRP